ncbi:MAG: hypothetical protein GY820_10505 [Gammaproteobacteria bacterium]|nr:hypothetical protein [Gammaproteobacteria bacterium]
MTIYFQLYPQEVPLDKEDYNLVMVKPDLVATYTYDGITALNAPTATTMGSAEYTFTPDQDGRYKFTLGVGTNDAYTTLSYYELNVQTAGQTDISATTAVTRKANDQRDPEVPLYGIPQPPDSYL